MLDKLFYCFAFLFSDTIIGENMLLFDRGKRFAAKQAHEISCKCAQFYKDFPDLDYIRWREDSIKMRYYMGEYKDSSTQIHYYLGEGEDSIKPYRPYRMEALGNVIYSDKKTPIECIWSVLGNGEDRPSVKAPSILNYRVDYHVSWMLVFDESKQQTIRLSVLID